VIHTHGALIRHLDNGNRLRPFNAEDILYSSAPWFWVAGFAFSLLGTIVAGARIIWTNEQESGAMLDFIERERPTLTSGFSAAVARLAADPSFERRDLSSIRRGTLHPILAPELRPRDSELRHSIYGMTEFGGAFTLSSDDGDLPEACRGSCGPVMPGFEAKIVNPETGETLGVGEIGELRARGPFLFDGYYGKPRSEAFDRDGWFRTGDLAMIDENGFFYLKGRLSNMIKTSGANVAPLEVENVLGKLTGGKACAVFGLPDAQRGQIVAAAIFTDDEVDEAALKALLAEKLSSYKVPRRIVRIKQSETPYLGNGKINLRVLAELAQAQRP